MIFYFSGTGNSRYVAEHIAVHTGDRALDICGLNPGGSITAETADSIGFVFPVYSWGVPPVMCDFVQCLSKDIVTFIHDNDIPVWMVATCGDETGDAHRMFRNLLKSVNIELRGCWSVIMPNTYVLLPGFDVDSDSLRIDKIDKARMEVRRIASRILNAEWEEKVTVGSFPTLKTRIVYPLFKKWGIKPSKWHSTDDCTGCGACSTACPVGNISIVGSKPKWGDNCTSCLACYHVCLRHAVHYADMTGKKGQYLPCQRILSLPECGGEKQKDGKYLKTPDKHYK